MLMTAQNLLPWQNRPLIVREPEPAFRPALHCPTCFTDTGEFVALIANPDGSYSCPSCGVVYENQAALLYAMAEMLNEEIPQMKTRCQRDIEIEVNHSRKLENAIREIRKNIDNIQAILPEEDF